ncbi:MAG: hypothetical protein WC551_14290 [Patescibacteria group bacterium]
MNAWFQTKEYERFNSDNKIAAWAEHCKDIERERDAAQQALGEAIDEMNARNQGYWDLDKYDRWQIAAGRRTANATAHGGDGRSLP